MNLLSAESLMAYWSAPELEANGVILCNLVGALLLGFVVGYERTYHGRAAGMRTYGLVCMASAALTVVSGYSQFWFGGHLHTAESVTTQVIQGIVTGVGFLGAGVILKEGMNISGLTTAASIWASSSIGVLVGLGFYATAIVLAFLSAGCMMYATRLEQLLPSRPAVAVVLKFRPGELPTLDALGALAANHGFELARATVSICEHAHQSEWRFAMIARSRRGMASITDLADAFRAMAGVEGLALSSARN